MFEMFWKKKNTTKTPCSVMAVASPQNKI